MQTRIEHSFNPGPLPPHPPVGDQIAGQSVERSFTSFAEFQFCSTPRKKRSKTGSPRSQECSPASLECEFTRGIVAGEQAVLFKQHTLLRGRGGVEILTFSKAVFLRGHARRKEEQKADQGENSSHSMTPAQSYWLEHGVISPLFLKVISKTFTKLDNQHRKSPRSQYFRFRRSLRSAQGFSPMRPISG